jgi:hypothetical protein
MNLNTEKVDPNIKKIIIEEPTDKLRKGKEAKETKEINFKKEVKYKIETKTWGLNEEELTYSVQLDTLNKILSVLNNETNDKTKTKDKYTSMFISHIKEKIGSYKQQDILKKKFNEGAFIDFHGTIDLLKECELKCYYCSTETYVLYEKVRESKQWSLDRIDNNIGHNKGNLVISCLECNLKRRRTNKDKFLFTKNMKIIREGI